MVIFTGNLIFSVEIRCLFIIPLLLVLVLSFSGEFHSISHQGKNTDLLAYSF